MAMHAATSEYSRPGYSLSTWVLHNLFGGKALFS
jgi:hypothetical protein